MICRVCDSKKLTPVIDLGMQPWCNDFLQPEQVGKEPFYPLRVVYCEQCSTSQLDFTVPKEIMFGNHTYLSGVTKSLSNHFRTVAHELDQQFFSKQTKKSVLDIGSNDGTQLKHFKELGYDVLGVESSKRTAQLAIDAGVPTVNEYFNEELVKKLNRKFDLINAAGVFFHLEELHSVTRGIQLGLDENGVFCVQFLYMKSIVDNCAFDQIYHEHLLYYTLRTIGTLLDRHGLEMFDCYLAPIHGGSVIGYVGHKGKRLQSNRYKKMLAAEDDSKVNSFESYKKFYERIVEMKNRNMDFLKKARAAGKKVFGMGAPVKGNTLLNYFGVDSSLIEYLVEKNPLRNGLVAPGSHIPVILEDDVKNPPDIYYVLAWNFKKEILENNKALLARGVEFFFPVDPQ